MLTSVMLEPGIGPLEGAVAMAGLTDPLSRFAMLLSPVPPVIALPVGSCKRYRAVGAMKRIRRRGTPWRGRSGA